MKMLAFEMFKDQIYIFSTRTMAAELSWHLALRGIVLVLVV